MTFEQAVKELELRLPLTKVPISVLKEDVILAVERPGSWEGSNMRDVLHSHGFLRDY